MAGRKINVRVPGRNIADIVTPALDAGSSPAERKVYVHGRPPPPPEPEKPKKRGLDLPPRDSAVVSGDNYFRLLRVERMIETRAFRVWGTLYGPRYSRARTQEMETSDGRVVCIVESVGGTDCDFYVHEEMVEDYGPREALRSALRPLYGVTRIEGAEFLGW